MTRSLRLMIKFTSWKHPLLVACLVQANLIKRNLMILLLRLRLVSIKNDRLAFKK